MNEQIHEQIYGCKNIEICVAFTFRPSNPLWEDQFGNQWSKVVYNLEIYLYIWRYQYSEP